MQNKYRIQIIPPDQIENNIPSIKNDKIDYKMKLEGGEIMD